MDPRSPSKPARECRPVGGEPSRGGGCLLCQARLALDESRGSSSCCPPRGGAPLWPAAKSEELGGEGRVCQRHVEPLGLFCVDDRVPLCLLCGLSKAHRRHAVVPLEKAAQGYKEQFQMELKMWKQRRKNLQTLKEAEAKRSWEILEKVSNERKKVVSEFEQLHQFLEDQEELLLARLARMEEEAITEERAIMSMLSEEISNLSDLISEMEEKCQQPVNEILQDIKNILSRCEEWKPQQAVEHAPQLEKRISNFSEQNMHLEEILKKLKDTLSTELESTSLLNAEPRAWRGRRRLFALPYAEVKKRGRKVNVTLDPDTANPFLVLSADQKSVKVGNTWQDVPDNPERFDPYPCVLGCEGFTSGRHYWEVEVGTGRYWAVGFATESVRRKGELVPSPEEQIWALQQCGDYLEALTCPITSLSSSRNLQRIQIFVDYEEEQDEIDFKLPFSLLNPKVPKLRPISQIWRLMPVYLAHAALVPEMEVKFTCTGTFYFRFQE